jgi:hypothetical protein
MNNRRSFFKSLIGLIVAPKVAEALPVAKPPVEFNKAMIPLIRRTFPELITHNLVGVQPMSGPIGLTFYMNYIKEGELV